MPTVIKWNDTNASEQGYNIYKSDKEITPDALPNPLAEVAANVTSYDDTALAMGQIANYRIGSRVAGTSRSDWLSSNKKIISGNLDFYADFTGATTSFVKSSQSSPALSTLVEDTHAQNIYVPGLGDTLDLKSANVLCRGAAGLQTAPTSTNLCLRSCELDHSIWIGSGITRSANTLNGPDGTMTADTYAYPDAAVSYTMYQVIAVTPSTQYTWSYYVKLGTKTNNRYAIYDETNAAFIINETHASGVNANTWTRVVVTFTTPAGCTTIRVYPDRHPANISGPSGNTIFLWGTQLEQGGFATPFILTTTATVTRNANRQTILGLGDILHKGGLSFFIKWNQLRLGASLEYPRIISFNDATSDNELGLYLNSANSLLLFVRKAGTNYAEYPVTSGLTIGEHRIAISVGPDFATGRRVGQTQGAVDNTISLPTIDRLSLGGRYDASGNANFQHLSKIGYKLGPQNQATFDEMYAIAQAS